MRNDDFPWQFIVTLVDLPMRNDDTLPIKSCLSRHRRVIVGWKASPSFEGRGLAKQSRKNWKDKPWQKPGRRPNDVGYIIGRIDGYPLVMSK